MGIENFVKNERLLKMYKGMCRDETIQDGREADLIMLLELEAVEERLAKVEKLVAVQPEEVEDKKSPDAKQDSGKPVKK